MSRMLGGEKIGEGVYGCVVDKPLECDNNYIPPGADSKNLTKISKFDSLEPEVKASHILYPLKESSHYFGLLKGDVCRPKVSILKNTNVASCEVVKDIGINKLYIGRMAFAGISLQNYEFNPLTYDIYAFIKHILEAGSLMTLHGLIHRDLHGNNILIHDNGLPKIIDFGQTLYRKEKFTFSDLLFGFDPRFDQEPPEVTLWNAVEQSMRAHFMKTNLSSYIKQIVEKKTVIGLSSIFTKQTKYQQIEELLKYTRESKAFIDRDYNKWWDLYWSKFDAWSIGSIITKLLNTLMKHKSFILNKSYISHKNTIYHVVQGLLEIDPRKRIDLIEALNIVDPNSHILKKYGKNWIKMRLEQKGIGQ